MFFYVSSEKIDLSISSSPISHCSDSGSGSIFTISFTSSQFSKTKPKISHIDKSLLLVLKNQFIISSIL